MYLQIEAYLHIDNFFKDHKIIKIIINKEANLLLLKIQLYKNLHLELLKELLLQLLLSDRLKKIIYQP